ncbi:MAG: hypothetical protein IIV74_03445 [Alphaproteobacteria bacterium]|nr:hypothetical protein [Alphaproteobacteria bacterium]
MMKIFRKFLPKLFVIVLAIGLVSTAFGATTNLPMGDIGDHGTWATDNNREKFVSQVSDDINEFQGDFQEQLVHDYVPIEAKVGLTFMNAMSFVAGVLDSSLVRFVILFMFIAFAFWITFETYNMMQSGKGEVLKLMTEIVKKGTMIAIWVIILGLGPAQLFMWIMGPIVTVGTYASDLILGAVAESAGANLPDTCAAIREYATTHISPENIIDANAAADILCIPTRMSGFCYTAIAAGWKWITAGIGSSAFSVIGGIVFIVAFIMLAWKFAFMALGVIADLFLGVMMLPFTALTQTVGSTSYKGIAGDIFNKFLGIFSAETLDRQIERFVQAALYFVSLSIVIAFCAALLSGVVDTDLSSRVPNLNPGGFLETLLVVLLTWWFASRGMDIAKKLGGSISTTVGDQMRGDVTTLWNNTYGTAKEWWKIIRDRKK